MISIGLIVLMGVDLVLLTYGKFKFYYVAIKQFYNTFKENLNKQKTSSIDTSTAVKENGENKEKITNKQSSTMKTLKIIGRYLLIIIIGLVGLGVLLFIIGLVTASIWGTILLAIHRSFVHAAAFLIGIKLLFFLLGLLAHKIRKVDKSVTQRVLIMDTIQFSMLTLLLYFARFGYPIQVIDMVTIPYSWNVTFNNLLSIIFPMVFFSIVTVNILAVSYRLRNIFTKDRNKHKLIRVHQLLFVFIAFCYFGILYITDIDLSFISDVNRTMYLQTLEVVKWILTSVFIPLFLYTLNNINNKQEIRKPKARYRRHYY